MITGSPDGVADLRELVEREFLLSLLDTAIKNRADWLVQIISWFKTDWISNPTYRLLAEQIIKCMQDGHPVTDAALAKALYVKGAKKTIQEAALLIAELARPLATQGHHLVYHAQQVHEHCRRMESSAEVLDTADEILTSPQIEKPLNKLATIPQRYADQSSNQRNELRQSFQRVIEEAYGKRERGITTGIPGLDGYLDGVMPGNIVVVGGQTGAGKSVMLGQIAWHIAAALEKPILYYSLEMSLEEMIERWASHISGISKKDKNQRKMYLDGLARVQNRMDYQQFITLRCGSFTIEQIISEAKARHSVMPLGAVFVDYIQIVEPSDYRLSRTEQLSKVMRGMRIIGSALRIPVFTASQFNRATDAPDIRGLKGSGSIEQDANIVLLLDPDEDKDEDPVVPVTIRIAKHRMGGRRRHKVLWNKPIYRYSAYVPQVTTAEDST